MADSDSENEGILTNIQHLVIRPPGHTGKAKKGHICFDGSYETMNLGRVDFITNQEYDVFIRPDTANPRNRFWFHFTVENTQEGQRVLFNVVNLSKSRCLFSEGLTPCVKSSSRPRWQRMPEEHCFYYRSPLHKQHFVLSFAFCFDQEDERYHFALAQPYSLARYEAYMAEVKEKKLDYLRLEVLTTTVQGRPLELLTITDPANLNRVEKQQEEEDKGFNSSEDKEENKEEEEDIDNKQDKPDMEEREVKEVKEDTEHKMKLPVVFLMARAHASDAAASFAVQGFLDFLLSSHEIAADLRSKVIFKVIPMLNPDGVFLGNTRGNLLGQDLNRHWNAPCSFSQPTVHAVRNLILQLDKDPALDLNVVLDLHAHTSLTGLFVCGNSYDDVYRFERHIVFPKILSQNCTDFSHANSVYNNDASKAGTARRYFCESLGPEVNSYTVEVSALGYETSDYELVTYTEESYCRVGRNIARAFWDYYKILGYIPLEDEDGRPRSANASMGSFNLLRLREVASQRDKTAMTFEGKGGKGFGDNSDEEQEQQEERKISGSSLKKDNVRRKKINSSIGNGPPVTATINLDNDNYSAEDEEDSDSSSSTTSAELLLAPTITRVKFRDVDNLVVVPTASVAKKESPFASPCKKSLPAADFVLNNNSDNNKRFPSRLSQLGPANNQLVLQHEMMVSRLGSSSSVVYLQELNSHMQVRKVGGGAYVSTTSSAPLRPQGLRPTITAAASMVAEEEKKPQKLAIVDFSAMAEQGSPKKKKGSGGKNVRLKAK